MKYRNKTKIKKKHHLINDLEKILSKLEKFDEVNAIIPGIIKKCNHNDKLTFFIRYKLPNGIKCYAKNNGAIQEIFIISCDTKKLIANLSSFITKNNLI